jgi:hypothetical protein
LDVDDARAEELHNLRLALATFALQLDAFEVRLREGRPRGGTKPGMPALALGGGRGLPKEKMNGGQ